LIVALIAICFGGYFRFFGKPWNSPLYGVGLGVLALFLIMVLALGGA
jgi:hypothetical protein